MTTNPQRKPMTLEAFLDFEERQPERYEFVDGNVFMMAGGSVAHDTIRLNLATTLRAKLAGRPCRPYLDLKLVCANGRSRYPDIAVMCGPRDPKETRLTDPVLLAEVLSPSTQATDYIVKSVDYGSVASVAVYLLVEQAEPRVDIVRRVDGALEPVAQAEGLDALIELPELDIVLTLRDIYADTTSPVD